MGCSCAPSICIKIIGFLSVIIAMSVLGICGWTLANTFKPMPLGFLDIPTGVTVPITHDNEYNNRSSSALAYNQNTTSQERDAGRGISREQNDDEVDGLENSTDFIRIWESMSPKFKQIIQISTSAAIVIALLQLLFSMTILCSTRKRIRGKTKLWQLSQFIIVLLFLMCILVPFSYNREKDKFRGANTFGKYIKTQVSNLILHGKYGADSPVKFFMNDLNSYYIILSLDVLFSFSFLLMSCCCVQCTTKNYYQTV